MGIIKYLKRKLSSKKKETYAVIEADLDEARVYEGPVKLELRGNYHLEQDKRDKIFGSDSNWIKLYYMVQRSDVSSIYVKMDLEKFREELGEEEIPAEIRSPIISWALRIEDKLITSTREKNYLVPQDYLKQMKTQLEAIKDYFSK